MQKAKFGIQIEVDESRHQKQNTDLHGSQIIPSISPSGALRTHTHTHKWIHLTGEGYFVLLHVPLYMYVRALPREQLSCLRYSRCVGKADALFKRSRIPTETYITRHIFCRPQTPSQEKSVKPMKPMILLLNITTMQHRGRDLARHGHGCMMSIDRKMDGFCLNRVHGGKRGGAASCKHKPGLNPSST
jgi:hypothetical protein